MKNFLIKSLLCALILMGFSCSGGGEMTKIPLTISESSIKTTVLGETKTLTLESPTAWYASSTGKDWISIKPSYGEAGKSEVKIVIKDNNTYDSRSADVTFTAGTEKTSVRVTQEWSYYFKLPCQEYTIGYGGGDIIIDGLPKTGGYVINISVDAQKWVKTKGNILEVAYNQTTTARNTIIKIIDSVNNKEYEVLLMQGSSSGNDNVLALSELVIDDYRCPSDSFTADSDFLYAVDMDDPSDSKTVKITFRGEGVQWLTIGDSDKKVYSGDVVTINNFTANNTIKLYSHNKSTDKVGVNNLGISGLPIIEIYTSDQIRDEPKVDCTIKLFDPKGRTDDGDNKNLVYFESKAGIEYRGAGAQRYVKKPYNFKLKGNDGEKREAELLNLRNDNSWILDGMYLDVAHMRNRVCFDLWNQFNKPYYVNEKPKAMSGTEGHYVEVFINGQYMGLFILSDRIDRKKYQIDQHTSKDANDGGYIYKAKGWTDACLMKGYSKRSSNDDYYWSVQIEQEYPGEDDGKPNFNPMADIIDFVAKTSPEEFSKRFGEVFDMTSVVDAFIFLNMIVADDNIGRNTFWIIRNIKTAPKVIHGVWDLDGSLGRNWDRHKEPAKQDQSSYKKGWVIGHGNNGSGTRFYFHERIIDENPANIHQMIYDRWQEIKNGALSPSNFNKIVDSYAEIQKASGAMNREVARWRAIDKEERSKWNYEDVYYGDLDTETSYMKTWYSERHAVLDKLINSLEHK